jgi:predicted secreted protein
MSMPHTVVRTAGVALLACAVALLQGCTQGEDLTTAVTSLSMRPELAQDEATASIAVTEMLNLRLPVQGGTGFAWALARPMPSDDPVRWVSSATEAPGAPQTERVGGREWYEITFVGARPGRTTIELVYRRPWEADVPPAKTYRVDVEVVKAPG